MNAQDPLRISESAVQVGPGWINLSEAPSTPELRMIWDLSNKLDTAIAAFDANLKALNERWAGKLSVTKFSLRTDLGTRVEQARSEFLANDNTLANEISALRGALNQQTADNVALALRVASLERPWRRKLLDRLKGWFR